MAVTSEAGHGPARETEETAPRAAPGWVVPLYMGGLVFVYLGEHVTASWDPHWILTLIGGLAVVGATVLRFSPRFRAGGERKGIENLLAILSVVGVVGLGVYALTTERGLELLGISAATPETRDQLKGILNVVWVALILFSIVPMIFAETALYPMRRALVPEGRRVRMAATNGMTLALAAIYGSLFIYAAADLGAAADFSYFKTSRPSDSTRKIAESLTEPVRVIAFFPDVNEARNEVEHYLKDLSRGTKTLKVEVKDPLLVPKLANEMRVTQDGAIVLSRGSTTETLIIGTDIKDARPKLKTLDQDFQEKLLKIARSRRSAYVTAGHGELTDAKPGANESGRSGQLLRQLLQKQNYLVKELGIGQGLGSDVPQDADVVLILGPSQPFAPEELNSLQRYAEKGGHLLIALDPDVLSETDWASEPAVPPGGEPPPGEPQAGDAGAPAKPKAEPAKPKPVAKADAGAPAAAAADAGAPALPPGTPLGARLATTKGMDRLGATLDALAELADIVRVPGVLTNDVDHLRRRFNESDNTLLLTNTFSSHAAVSTLSRNSARAAVVSFGAAAVDQKPGSKATVDFAIKSRVSTFPDLNQDYKADPNTEERRAWNMAAAVSISKGKPKEEKKEEKKDDKKKDESEGKKPPEGELRAFVIGDADAFSDIVLSNVVANQVLFVDAVRWLGGEESFTGERTTEEDVQIEHTKQKDQLWFYATIFGAPAIVLASGLFYSRRSKKNKKRGGRS